MELPPLEEAIRVGIIYKYKDEDQKLAERLFYRFQENDVSEDDQQPWNAIMPSKQISWLELATYTRALLTGSK